jgi:hypothetical protein
MNLGGRSRNGIKHSNAESSRRSPRKCSRLAALAIGILAVPTIAQAQSAIIYGSLGNFDISNDTGKICNGFQVELDGVNQIPYSFSAERYGAPAVVPSATGTIVRWQSPYDPNAQQFAQRTLPHTVTWFPGQCYMWNPATYQDSGCEHFGTGYTGNATRALANWLCEDPANPGTLIPNNPPTAVPMPTYYVQAPAAPNNPPVLVIEVQAPEPAEAPNLFGNAQWMRVFKVELQQPVADLNALVADNPNIVPMDPAQLESNWQIIQDEPVAGGNGKRKRKRNQGNIDPTTRAVVRRIEMYTFIGDYDPITHEALCADGLCNAPAVDEIGDLESVQMTVANVQADAVLVTKTGNGNVESSDKLIACGNKCNQPYNAGTRVTLNAKPGSGSTFLGWTGACAGTAGSCAVTVNGGVNVGATFSTPAAAGGGGGGGGGGAAGGGTTQFTLSVGRSNPGTVTATPNGVDRALSCGSACSAKFNSGTAVTLTATPPAGKQFVSWGGACSGTANTCTVSVNANLSVQASFSK